MLETEPSRRCSDAAPATIGEPLGPASSAWQPDTDEFGRFGFDGLEGDLRAQVAKAELRDGPPAADVVDDFVFLPHAESGLGRREREHLAGTASSGVDGRRLPLLDEEVVYLGWRFNHYGHFLMQSLARAWFLSEVPPSVRVLFHHPSQERWQPTGWSDRMLAAFGVPPERVVTLRQPTRVRRVLLPEPLFAPRAVAGDHVVRAHVRMAEPYRAVAERLGGDAPPTDGPVYLSRSRLPSGQRQLVGEARLEHWLRRQGVAIAHPERMSFAEQVRLVNRHTDLISNAGSAAQNVLFALHRPRLHLLTNGTNFSPDYFLHQTVCGTPTTFVNALGTCGRATYPRAQKQTPLALDLGTLAAYLAGRGFVSGRTPAAPAPDACAGPAYAEAWLYGWLREVGRREPLPPEVAAEAAQVAARSWPVSLALAWAKTVGSADPADAAGSAASVDALAMQFASLATDETDGRRITRHREDVVRMAPHVARRCGRPAGDAVRAVLANRFEV